MKIAKQFALFDSRCIRYNGTWYLGFTRFPKLRKRGRARA